MARTRKTGIEALDAQILAAQEDYEKKKVKYEEAKKKLQELQDKRKLMLTDDLINAVQKSEHSIDEIMDFINSASKQ